MIFKNNEALCFRILYFFVNKRKLKLNNEGINIYYSKSKWLFNTFKLNLKIFDFTIIFFTFIDRFYNFYNHKKSNKLFAVKYHKTLIKI